MGWIWTNWWYLIYAFFVLQAVSCLKVHQEKSEDDPMDPVENVNVLDNLIFQVREITSI